MTLPVRRKSLGCHTQSEGRACKATPSRKQKGLGTGGVRRTRARGFSIRGQRSWIFHLKREKRHWSSSCTLHLDPQAGGCSTVLVSSLVTLMIELLRSSVNASTDTPGNHALLAVRVSLLSQCVSQNYHHSWSTFVWLSQSTDEWINTSAIKNRGVFGSSLPCVVFVTKMLGETSKAGAQSHQAARCTFKAFALASLTTCIWVEFLCFSPAAPK